MKRIRSSSFGVYMQPAFLLCLIVLTLAAAVTHKYGAIEKEPLPLVNPLDTLDANGLGSYAVVAKLQIDNEEMLKELGTKDYVQWILEDTQAENEAVKRVLLFITYYGYADRVPHVPEECFVGGGFQKLASDGVTFYIDVGGFRRRVDGKYLVFANTRTDYLQPEVRFPVLYFFRVNASYAGNRDDARMALNKSLFSRYSYFSKVEIAFNQTPVVPNEEDAVRATTKLLSVILPILEARHWPDWEKVISKSKQ